MYLNMVNNLDKDFALNISLLKCCAHIYKKYNFRMIHMLSILMDSSYKGEYFGHHTSSKGTTKDISHLLKRILVHNLYNYMS